MSTEELKRLLIEAKHFKLRNMTAKLEQILQKRQEMTNIKELQMENSNLQDTIKTLETNLAKTQCQLDGEKFNMKIQENEHEMVLKRIKNGKLKSDEDRKIQEDIQRFRDENAKLTTSIDELNDELEFAKGLCRKHLPHDCFADHASGDIHYDSYSKVMSNNEESIDNVDDEFDENKSMDIDTDDDSDNKSIDSDSENSNSDDSDSDDNSDYNSDDSDSDGNSDDSDSDENSDSDNHSDSQDESSDSESDDDEWETESEEIETPTKKVVYVKIPAKPVKRNDEMTDGEILSMIAFFLAIFYYFFLIPFPLNYLRPTTHVYAIGIHQSPIGDGFSFGEWTRHEVRYGRTLKINHTLDSDDGTLVINRYGNVLNQMEMEFNFFMRPKHAHVFLFVVHEKMVNLNQHDLENMVERLEKKLEVLQSVKPHKDHFVLPKY